MDITPSIQLDRARRRRKRRAVVSQPTPPPAALVLVSAVYDSGIPKVRLTFDRAINLGGYDGTAVVVDDEADTFNAYQGTGGAFPIGANAVDIFLVDPTVPTGPGTTLTATAANGIVAVDDGGAWAGCVSLTLPFP